MKIRRSKPAQIQCPSLLAITGDSDEVRKVADAFGMSTSDAAGVIADCIQRIAVIVAQQTGRDPDEVAGDLLSGPAGD
jgi:hypothetical protein